MKLKRLISGIVALVLVLSMSVSAFAEAYDLANGSIEVTANESGQYVTQSANNITNEQQTTPTVITQSGESSTSNTITVSTSDGAKAELTIRDIHIGEVYGKSAIEIGNSNATINVEGQNTITVDYKDSPSEYDRDTALVHVSGGELTITIRTGGKLELENQYSNGAMIGSDRKEDFTGKIHITGNVDLTAGTEESVCDGAGIGSGKSGNFKGTVLIDGNAKVKAVAQDDGAGIGSGKYGDMSGKVIIVGNAQVTADSNHGNTAIGSGRDGDLEDGFAVIVADTAGINDVMGSNYNRLREIYKLSEEDLTVLKIADNGKDGFQVEVLNGESEVDKILYGGSETMPTAPGSYPVTVVLKIGKETVEFEVGTLVIAEQDADENMTEPLYRVTDKDGSDIAHKAEHKDGVLTITAEEDFAILTGKVSGIDTLKRQGIEKIVFVTKDGTSAFMSSDLLEKGKSSDTYKLTHNGETVTFTVDEKKTDVSGILIKP